MICPSQVLGPAILACFFEGLRLARARLQAKHLACQGETMQLDDQQKKIVAGWIEEGLDLSAIQARLESELNISMTYMDVRFLVGDLELMPKDEEESAEEEDEVEDEPVGAMSGGPSPEDPSQFRTIPWRMSQLQLRTKRLITKCLSRVTEGMCRSVFLQ